MAVSALSIVDPVLRALADDEQRNEVQIQRQTARFTQIMNQIKQNLHKIEGYYQQQASSGGAPPAELSPLLQESYLSFLELKSISRQLTNLGEVTKTQLLERKKRLDAINLQNESILYEQGHLQKMIAVQNDFHSQFPVPELVSDVEFSQANPEAPQDRNTHDGWMARLRDELRRREEMLAEQKQLEAKNEALASEFEEMQQRKRDFILMSKELFRQLKSVEGNLSENLDKEVDYFHLDGQKSVPMDR